ncbi:MAG: hypothetical protein LBQ95_04655, partial [Lachnospiraceae bacterium]|nr:hypothetical protein [Lachnospiraceae bacterium]
MRAFLADLGYTTAVTAADTTLFTNTWNEIYAPPGPSANTGGIIGNYDVDGYVTWLYPVQAFGPAPTINLSEFSKLVVARIELSLAHRTLNVIDNPVLRTLYLVDTSYEDLSDLIIKDCPSLTALGLDFPGYGTASYWDLSQITARYPDIYKYWPINDSNIVAQPFEVSLPTVTAPTTVYSMEQNSTDTITITATPATSSGTLGYQWYETNSSGTTSNEISGATSETYSPDTSTIGGPYYYYCVVTSIDEYDNGNSEQLNIKTGT